MEKNENVIIKLSMVSKVSHSSCVPGYITLGANFKLELSDEIMKFVWGGPNRLNKLTEGQYTR